MDYPCGKFGDCSFSRFGFYGADTHTHTHTHTHTLARARMIAILTRFPSARVMMTQAVQVTTTQYQLIPTGDQSNMALLLTTLTWSGISAEINNNNNNNWLCKFISMTITEMNNYNWQLNVRDSVDRADARSVSTYTSFTRHSVACSIAPTQ